MMRYPYLLLLAVPVIFIFIFPLIRRRKKDTAGKSHEKSPHSQASAVQNPAPHSGASVSGSTSVFALVHKTWRIALRRTSEVFMTISALCMVILLAGPQKVIDTTQEKSRGLEIMIVFDRSSSMSAFVPFGSENVRRIDALKKVTDDFLSRRTDDKFALITFARYPETNSPMTANKELAAGFLSMIDIPETQDEDGTAIGDALLLAAARMNTKKTPAAADQQNTSQTDQNKGRLIILLTDGQNNRGETEPTAAAEQASKAGIPVYTIGLGGEGYVMQNTPYGPRAAGVPVSIDEKQLKQIAQITGGRYFRADKIEDLNALYDDIAQRETIRLENDLPPATELVLTPLLAAALLFLLLSVFTRYSVLKRGDE